MNRKTKFLNIRDNYPIIIALIVQVFVLFIIRNTAVVFSLKLNAEIFILIQSLVCIIIYYYLKLPKWFYYLAILIPTFFYFAFTKITINNSIYGIIFLLLMFTFSHTLIERVPLYLSNKLTMIELKKIVDSNFDGEIKFIDLGSGTGRVVRAINSKKIEAYGAETAPFIFLYSYILAKIFGGKILRKSIWEINTNEYDCVYTFLSPAVMYKIHQKFEKEMRKGSILISNSFPILNLKPIKIIELKDQRKTTFYIYKK